MSDAPNPPESTAPAAAASPAAPAPKKRGWFRRWALPLLGLAAVGLGLAVVFRGFLVRKAVEEGVTRVTGFPLEIESVDLALDNARVEVINLRLKNPPGFGDPRCLYLSRLVADVDLPSLLTDEFHAEEMEVVIPEIVVVKNAQGEVNLDRLKALAEGEPAAPGEEPKPTVEEPAKELKWKCDKLHLVIGKVVFLDFTQMRNGLPEEDVWDLDVDEEFRDLTNPNQIIRIIVLKVITGTPIRLVNGTAESLKNGLVGVVGIAGGVVKGAGGIIKGAADGIGGAIEGIFGGGKKEEPPPPPSPPPPPKKKR